MLIEVTVSKSYLTEIFSVCLVFPKHEGNFVPNLKNFKCKRVTFLFIFIIWWRLKFIFFHFKYENGFCIPIFLHHPSLHPMSKDMQLFLNVFFCIQKTIKVGYFSISPLIFCSLFTFKERLLFWVIVIRIVFRFSICQKNIHENTNNSLIFLYCFKWA